MKMYHAAAVVLGMLASVAAGAQENQVTTGKSEIAGLPRDLEMELALRALPPHLRDKATVYVLNPAKGFEVARKGTNGFHAFVARTGDDTFRGTWSFKAYRDDILYPISFDEAGVNAQMRVFFDAAAMQAEGMPPEELKKQIQERYATHYYKAPERVGVSYMMAPILRTYLKPDENDSVGTANIPHVMHYMPNVSNADVGGATPTAEQMAYFTAHGHWRDNQDPFVILHGPHGYMVQFLGKTERESINQEYQPMLERLCAIKKVWCLPE